VKVDIVDDDEYEDEMEFFIDLATEDPEGVEIFGPTCAVTIIDDDDPGMLSFKEEQVNVAESAKEVEIAVLRRKGASGKVSCKVSSEDGTAKENVDFEPVEELEVEFDSQEVDASIKLVFPESDKRNRVGKEFRLVMTDPTGGCSFPKDTDGGDDSNICTIVFVSDEENKALIRKAHSSLMDTWEVVKAGGSTWGDQFVAALYCNGSKEEQKEAGKLDWILHILSLPWKLFCACIPPTNYANGWFTFYGAL